MPILFARIQDDVPLKLRKGAWYRIVELNDLQAVIEVNRRKVSVLRAWLEIRDRPPQRWAVVEGKDNQKAPPPLRGLYGVCPNCRARTPLPKKARTHQCKKCGNEFEIDWAEAGVKISG
jgi:Zn finger protein HypA/HybF involved in hydrogenase expression